MIEARVTQEMLIPVMLLSIPVITSNIAAFSRFAVFNKPGFWICILLR